MQLFVFYSVSLIFRRTTCAKIANEDARELSLTSGRRTIVNQYREPADRSAVSPACSQIIWLLSRTPYSTHHLYIHTHPSCFCCSISLVFPTFVGAISATFSTEPFFSPRFDLVFNACTLLLFSFPFRTRHLSGPRLFDFLPRISLYLVLWIRRRWIVLAVGVSLSRRLFVRRIGSDAAEVCDLLSKKQLSN